MARTKFQNIQMAIISQSLMCSEGAKRQTDPCYVFLSSEEQVTN